MPILIPSEPASRGNQISQAGLIDLFVREAGGPGSLAVVLLHGVGASGKMWAEHMRLLTGHHCMAPDLHQELTARGVGLALVDLIAGVRDTLDRAGVLERVGPQMVFDTAEDALSAFRGSAD